MKNKIILKFIVLICIVFASPSFTFATGAMIGAAGTGTLSGESGGGGEEGPDVCTGSLVASWYMEDLDLANEDGCSALGDTVWEAYSAVTLTDTDKSEGTYSGYCATTYDYHLLDVTQNFPTDEGTIWLDIRIGSEYSADNRFFSAIYNSVHEIQIQLQGGTGAIDIMFVYEEGGYYGVKADTNIDYTDNKWYRIKLQWKVDGDPYDMQIDVWELDSSTPRATTGSPTTTSALNNIDAMIAPISARIGVTSVANTLYWDRFKLYNTSDL